MEYDLLVIGGGINGLGIAADAAARGLKTRIVERRDWGGGTTAASSRLIHGGLRYLQYGEWDLVKESLRERGILARQRPHLVHPIQLLIPAGKNAPTPKWMIGAGLFLYELLARDPLFPRPTLLSRRQIQEREPCLDSSDLTGGFVYPDAQIEFPERMCVELYQEVRAAGGDAHNYTCVVRLIQENDCVIGAWLRDELTGEQTEVRARLTINAAGPWLDVVNQTLKTPPPAQIGGTWGTHLILPRSDQGPRGPLYATARHDGRPFFVLPWDDRLLVGTTDVKFTGAQPDQVRVQPWEIEYLLREINHLFPAAHYRQSDIEATTIGIRPLPVSDQRSGAITRRHFLVDHQTQHGIGGLASIVGGKLTTYRALAEEAVDEALRLLHRSPVATATHVVLPGPTVAEMIAACQSELARLHLPEHLAGRLVRLYGPAYADVLGRAASRPALARLLPEMPAVAAQILHSVTAEGARTVDDIARRRLMLLPATDRQHAQILQVCRELALPVARINEENAPACPD